MYEHAILGPPTAMESKLAVDICIRGHLIFKYIWTLIMDEQLSYKREIAVAYWCAWASTSDLFL